MSLNDAAQTLNTHLTTPDRPDWFQAVGAGDDELMVFTQLRKHGIVSDVWEGFPVKIMYVGKLVGGPYRPKK